MVQVSSAKPLPYIHISQATDEIVHYIKERRDGNVKSLATKWPAFNKTCMGGIEPNTIITVGGISGSGKSSFVNALESDLFDLNSDIDFCVLSFNMEMISSRQVGRKLSAKLNKTTSQLYSGNPDVQLTDSDIECIENSAKSLKKYEIYYVDTPGTVKEMQDTITYFQETVAKGRWLVVMIDHVLLTKGADGQSERIVLGDLQKMLMQAKKAKVCNTTIIQISQMNRGIEDAHRTTNPSAHFPTRSDIFGADSIYQASDYVHILHRPETLNIEHYGPEKLPVENLVYLHVIKNREGAQGIMPFINNLKHNKLENINNTKKD